MGLGHSTPCTGSRAIRAHRRKPRPARCLREHADRCLQARGPRRGRDRAPRASPRPTAVRADRAEGLTPAVGETRVDLLHLLEDLRDAYPGPAEETILTEIVANSLDSRATVVTITTDPALRTFTLVDDGTGMRRRELARYHDVAASTKVKGEGIGFAGIGIKIALLVSHDVLTETRQRKTQVATMWALASRHRAPWKWVPPPGLVGERGTAVRLTVDDALSPLLDPGFIETALRRHFQPLLDPVFADILSEHYPVGVEFRINGTRLTAEEWSIAESAALAVRVGRRRKPSAVGYLVRERGALPEDRRGLSISTLGKVIKR